MPPDNSDNGNNASDISPAMPTTNSPTAKPPDTLTPPPNEEKDEAKDRWKWAGPILGLVGGLVAGLCAIIAVKCSRGVTVRARSAEKGAIIDQVDVFEA